MKNRHIMLITMLPVCFGLLSNAHGVVPAPDGDYPGFNTAEGQNALFSLTRGSANTAVGWFSLKSNLDTSFNTAVGAGALLFNTADENTAVGAAALLLNTTGSANTATGTSALLSNTTGFGNTATGGSALASNADGNSNTATGYFALSSNTAGSNNVAIGNSALASSNASINTAVGFNALTNNTTGNENTGVGAYALVASTGGFNTAVGSGALVNNTTGFNNIAVGQHSGHGVSAAHNVICIGTDLAGGNVDNSCFIKGIFFSDGSGGSPVTVGLNHQLGTVTSSKRFKQDIKPMDKTSEVLLALKPVTFRYKKERDPRGIQQFGLVAEDVEKVNPDLVVRDKEGKPYSVRYDQVNAMLLNEFLKEHRKVQEQAGEIQEQKATISELKKRMETVVFRLQEQESKIQRVNAQLQMSQVARCTTERIRRGEALPQAIVNNSRHPN